jgi:Arc/MetJ-type ribon-helix-helix transcriptional regulator
MARSQKVVPIKLNQDQIAVLDKVVELGEFQGRSHAIRELVLPALNAGVTAMNQGSLRAMVTWVKEIDGLNQRMKTIEKNSLKGKQEDMDMDLGLPPIEVQPV